jgi:hypothetical protein
MLLWTSVVKAVRAKCTRAQNSAGTEVAVKVLSPNNINSERRRRFKNETLFCMKNSHRNVITVSDYGVISFDGKDCPFYVMPFYGETLRTLMNEGINKETALKYFSQILDGVEGAFEGSSGIGI